MQMETLEAYLRGKKIDPAQFRAGEPELYARWEALYAQQHPNSFTLQQLFVINRIRRRFPLPPEA
jgi:hypothetical protein